METERDYQIPQKTKKKSVWFWIVLAGFSLLVIFGLGSCVMMFSDLYQKITDRQAATQALLAKVLPEGLPDTNDPIYHSQANITFEALAHVNGLISAAGTPQNIGQSSCSAKTNASTKPIDNGTFVFCNTPIQYATTAGTVEMTWKLMDGNWKILRFYSGYDAVPETVPAEASGDDREESPSID